MFCHHGEYQKIPQRCSIYTNQRERSPQQLLSTHWGRDKMDAILQTTVSRAFSSMIKFSLKYVRKGSIDNNQALVQIMAWRRSGDKPLSEPMMGKFGAHICVSRPQWVSTLRPRQNGHYFAEDTWYTNELLRMLNQKQQITLLKTIFFDVSVQTFLKMVKNCTFS